MALTTVEANGVEAASPNGLQTVLSNTGIDRRSFSRIPTVWEMPDLVQVQIESFEWFKREGLRELLEEISPISDHHKKMELTFGEYRFDEPWKRLPEHLQQQGKDDPRIVEQFKVNVPVACRCGQARGKRRVRHAQLIFLLRSPAQIGLQKHRNRQDQDGREERDVITGDPSSQRVVARTGGYFFELHRSFALWDAVLKVSASVAIVRSSQF